MKKLSETCFVFFLGTTGFVWLLGELLPQNRSWKNAFIAMMIAYIVAAGSQIFVEETDEKIDDKEKPWKTTSGHASATAIAMAVAMTAALGALSAFTIFALLTESPIEAIDALTVSMMAVLLILMSFIFTVERAREFSRKEGLPPKKVFLPPSIEVGGILFVLSTGWQASLAAILVTAMLLWLVARRQKKPFAV